MLFRIEIHLAEREPWLDAKRVGVRLQIRVQVGVGRLGLGGDVVGNELHLLPQAAADDGVVLVQAQRHRLAAQDLLAHPVVGSVPPAPAPVGGRCQVLAKPSARCSICPCVTTILPGSPLVAFGHQAVGDEDRRAQQEEMQQRFPEERFMRDCELGAPVVVA